MLSQLHQLKMSSGTLYHVALFQTEISENVSSPASGVLRLIGFHSFHSASTVMQLWKHVNLRTPEDGGNTFS
jgi:hypothetical protein